MNHQNAFLLDPVNPQYLFSQYCGKSEFEGTLVCCVGKSRFNNAASLAPASDNRSSKVGKNLSM